MIGEEVELFTLTTKFLTECYRVSLFSGVFTVTKNRLNGVTGHHLKCKDNISSLSMVF